MNGELGGLKFLLDAETFAFTNREKHSNGFRIAFSYPHDKHLLTHDSYFISTGKYKLQKKLLCYIFQKYFLLIL